MIWPWSLPRWLIVMYNIVMLTSSLDLSRRPQIQPWPPCRWLIGTYNTYFDVLTSSSDLIMCPLSWPSPLADGWLLCIFCVVFIIGFTPISSDPEYSNVKNTFILEHIVGSSMYNWYHAYVVIIPNTSGPCMFTPDRYRGAAAHDAKIFSRVTCSSAPSHSIVTARQLTPTYHV